MLCSVAVLLYCFPAASCDYPKLLRSFSTCNLSSDGEYWKQFSLIKVVIKTALKSSFQLSNFYEMRPRNLLLALQCIFLLTPLLPRVLPGLGMLL